MNRRTVRRGGRSRNELGAMTHFAHLAQQLFNRPLALRPEKAEIIMAALADRLGIAQLRLPDGRIRAFDDALIEIASGDGFAPVEGYDLVNGIACIEVHGTLVQRQMGLRPISGMTGYNALRENFFCALADPSAKAVVLSVDSPGGDCAGLFDLVDDIHRARGKKPVWAILDENACSAAYAIASACDVVTVPRTGIAGSIGVIMLHVDLTRMLDKEGVTVTVLQYGERKADGQPVIPLSDGARRALQADIDTIGELFVDTVARNRRISPRQVRGQEAAVFMGGDAVAAGLADMVLSPAAAFQRLAALVAV